MMNKRAAKPTMTGAAIQALLFAWGETVAVGLAPDAVTLETVSVAVVVTRTVTCDMVEDGVGGEFREEAETDSWSSVIVCVAFQFPPVQDGQHWKLLMGEESPGVWYTVPVIHEV